MIERRVRVIINVKSKVVSVMCDAGMSRYVRVMSVLLPLRVWVLRNHLHNLESPDIMQRSDADDWDLDH